MTRAGIDIAEILERPIFVRDENVAFGELTLEDVVARADELRAATGWGPTARVAPVARAWRELANAIESTSASSVRELDEELLCELVLPGAGDGGRAA
jgi:hypothetical protein